MEGPKQIKGKKGKQARAEIGSLLLTPFDFHVVENLGLGAIDRVRKRAISQSTLINTCMLSFVKTFLLLFISFFRSL